MKTIFSLIISIVLYAGELHDSVKKLDIKNVHKLVENGSDINALDEKGRTALHLASSIGRISLVEYLVEHGANVHIKDSFNKTALVYAIEKNRVKIIILLSKKVNETKNEIVMNSIFSAAKEGNITAIIIFVENNDVNSVDADGKTALHIASDAGNIDIVELLLDIGIDKNILDHDGRTALNYAKLSGNKEIIKLLTQEDNATK